MDKKEFTQLFDFPILFDVELALDGKSVITKKQVSFAYQEDKDPKHRRYMAIWSQQDSSNRKTGGVFCYGTGENNTNTAEDAIRIVFKRWKEEYESIKSKNLGPSSWNISPELIEPFIDQFSAVLRNIPHISLSQARDEIIALQESSEYGGWLRDGAKRKALEKSDPKQTALMSAVNSADPVALERAIRDGADVDHEDQFGVTPFKAHIILEQKFTERTWDYKKRESVEYVKDEFTQCTQILVDAKIKSAITKRKSGIDVKHEPEFLSYMNKQACIAVQRGWGKKLASYIDAGIDMNGALEFAVEKKKFDSAKYLLRNGADIQHLSKLLLSIINSNYTYERSIDIADFILDNGYKYSGNGQDPLPVAIENNVSPLFISKLISCARPLNNRNTIDSAILAAAEYSHDEAMRIIIQSAQGNPSKSGLDKSLIHSLKHANHHNIKMLLSIGADLSRALKNEGVTLPEVFTLRNAQPNYPGRITDIIETIKILSSNNIDLNVVGNGGEMLLHDTSMKFISVDVISALCEAGFDPSISPNKDHDISPLNRARQDGQTEIVSLMESHALKKLTSNNTKKSKHDRKCDAGLGM